MAILRAIFSAWPRSISAAARSTSATTSPAPRMRPATRRASKSSSASIFSPAPRNLIGRPVTARMESAAPPRPSPSVRVSTRPVSGRRSWKALAVRTASWPVRLSATSRVSMGLAMRAISAASLIIASSRVVRPAVSRISTSKPPSFAALRARRAMSGADCPAMIGRTSISACLPRAASCSMAAGRRVSRDAISTFLRSTLVIRTASLAEVVVLPEPCRPAIRITAGGAVAKFRGWASSPPSMSTRPSWTILTTCSEGFTARSTASPVALSRALAMKSFTTGRATSASSRARRTSRRASSMSFSDSTPRPVSRSKTPVSRSPKASNIIRSASTKTVPVR